MNWNSLIGTNNRAGLWLGQVESFKTIFNTILSTPQIGWEMHLLLDSRQISNCPFRAISAAGRNRAANPVPVKHPVDRAMPDKRPQYSADMGGNLQRGAQAGIARVRSRLAFAG